MVRVDFTLQRLPASGPLKDACGIPLSCVVQPCGAALMASTPSSMVSALARCQHCFAYINQLCELSDSSFCCSICGKATELKHLTLWHSQYCRHPATRQHLPELQHSVYEVVVDPELQGSGSFGQQQLYYQQQVSSSGIGIHDGQPAAVPVTLLLVDVCGPDAFLELVRSGITASLEALDPASLVGVIGVSECITLVDMAGPGGPVLHNLPVLDAAPVLVPLEDVMPLECLLTTVATARQRITQALDLLLPESAAGLTRSSAVMSLQQPGMDRRQPSAAAGATVGVTANGAAAGSTSGCSSAAAAAASPQQQQTVGGSGRSPPCRAVGPALQAVLEYLRRLLPPQADATIAPDTSAWVSSPSVQGGRLTQVSGIAQLVLLLSGPPDIAYGRTIAATGAGSRASAAGLDSTIGPDSRDLQRQMQDLQLHYPVQDPKSKAFYEQAAVAAASMGIVVDIYAAARGFVGLQTLEPLVNSTGGALYLYPSPEEATLPQDLCRRLSTPKAVSGLLRLRTSPHLKISRSYGRLYPDQQYSDLFHVPCCDPGQAFVFDFDCKGSGAHDDKHVTVQVAFQYSQVVPVGPSDSQQGTTPSSSTTSSTHQQHATGGEKTEQGGSSSVATGAVAEGRSFVLQRRLRIATLRLPVALGPAEVYSSVDADTVLTVLTHKITKAVRTQSVAEARLLLRDWLVIFTTYYHRNSFMRASAAQLLQLPVDLTFSSCPPLQPLPRLVYALLRSPLLSAAAQYHSDLTAYLHHLWCCLPPRELAKAVYPGLRAFTDADTLIADSLPLSRESLQGPKLAEAAAAAARRVVTRATALAQATGAAEGTAGTSDAAEVAEAAAAAQEALGHATAVAEGREQANILLLDAFILVLVVYRQGAPADLPFPPPQQSQLWHTVNRIKRERRVTTHVEVVREGDDGADLFYSLLIDDPDELADAPIPPLDQQPVLAAAAAVAAGQQGANAPSSAAPSPTGVQQFVEHIRAEVFMQLQPQQ